MNKNFCYINMEVHHHPHVGAKKLKDYLSEGLMIFVAVTLGFFAEKLREHIYSHEREEEYISSLLNNLHEDENSLKITIHNNQKKVEGLDSLLSLNVTRTMNPADKQALYTYSQRYVSYYSGFSSNDATMMQLKNAGGFEYIKEHDLLDSIALYDLVIRNIYSAETPYAKAIDKAIDAMSEVLVFKGGSHDPYFMNAATTKQSSLPLLHSDPASLQVFFNRIYIERAWSQNYVDNLKETLEATKRLIALLKKKYPVD